MKVGEVIVKKLTNLVFKYKIYPALMFIMSVFFIYNSSYTKCFYRQITQSHVVSS